MLSNQNSISTSSFTTTITKATTAFKHWLVINLIKSIIIRLYILINITSISFTYNKVVLNQWLPFTSGPSSICIQYMMINSTSIANPLMVNIALSWCYIRLLNHVVRTFLRTLRRSTAWHKILIISLITYYLEAIENQSNCQISTSTQHLYQYQLHCS